MSRSEAIVYLGPSMPVQAAQKILLAKYRRPIRRGDLADVAPGTVVAIIDGVFEQNLAVSPREVHDAVARGVIIFGGASMGALRAAEVPGVIGVGRIFEWYRVGAITRDDEVALLFEEDSGRALTVPSVNVRFAVERLCRLGTIDQVTGDALLVAALTIPYKQRTYRSILEQAGILLRHDSRDLISMLEAQDLKYRDAQAVLETVDQHVKATLHCQIDSAPIKKAAGTVQRRNFALERPRPAATEVLIWESGDTVSHRDLFEFLAYTAHIEPHARLLATRLASRNVNTRAMSVTSPEVQSLFNSAAHRWGWLSSEEAKVTLSDLGLDLMDVDKACQQEACTAEQAAYFTRDTARDLRAFLASLFLDGLTLKRESLRLGSLRVLASKAEGKTDPEELKEAETVLCKLNKEFSFAAVRKRWARFGFVDEAAQDAFVGLLARARRMGRELTRGMVGKQLETTQIASRLHIFGLKECPKPYGQSRFCLPDADAEERARSIGQMIGITRISMIGELGDLGGIEVAQAARPGNAWSSSYGSGKSRTVAGAIVGSIMEETEKWAQEKFRPAVDLITGSYEDLRDEGAFVDPTTLDLPYDSVYHPAMSLNWYRCFDLLSCRNVYLPVDLCQMNYGKHDICFTRRGARKHLATNGLGSGFSREEAILHGLCEYVERHAQRIAELFLSNPGGLGPHPYRFIDLKTASSSVQDIVEKVRARGATVRILDITSEVRIPSFLATITRDLQVADGYGTHPDPNTAIEMALLEAGQNIASAIAGGREDLSIHARSLGRHERPRPFSAADAWFWLDPDVLYKTVSEINGFSSSDVLADIIWCVNRLHDSGVHQALVTDLTPQGFATFAVMRVVLPGLETNNPFYTGLRARVTLVRDLLPQWQ